LPVDRFEVTGRPEGVVRESRRSTRSRSSLPLDLKSETSTGPRAMTLPEAREARPARHAPSHGASGARRVRNERASVRLSLGRKGRLRGEHLNSTCATRCRSELSNRAGIR
jgi:hypothetical protein